MGLLPTAMVATTVLVTVLTTETVFLPLLATYTRVPSADTSSP